MKPLPTQKDLILTARREIAPPSKAFKSAKHYNRKPKYQKGWE